jgi:hypothetical protein
MLITSRDGLNEETTIQMRGKIIRSPPRMSTKWRKNFPVNFAALYRFKSE